MLEPEHIYQVYVRRYRQSYDVLLPFTIILEPEDSYEYPQLVHKTMLEVAISKRRVAYFFKTKLLKATLDHNFYEFLIKHCNLKHKSINNVACIYKGNHEPDLSVIERLANFNDGEAGDNDIKSCLQT